MSTTDRRRTWTYHDGWFPDGYRRHWEPVLAVPAIALLDRLAKALASTGGPAPTTLLDIGAGTGLLAIEAARRWPAATIIAADPAVPMLDVMRARADNAGIDPVRLVAATGPADDLPVADTSVDLAASSFVFQIVPDRPRALREVLRVLRPGAWFGYVTWLAGDRASALADAVDAVLGGPANTDWSGGAPRAGDVPSTASAAAELREAGFVDLRVEADELREAWTVDRYLAYLEGCRNPAAFEGLDEAARAALLARLRSALEGVPPSSLVQRAPVVHALGRRGA